jgi:biopolymer transport protein ExbD
MRVHIGTPRKSRIEMLPLIDIVFLLLIFFIFAMLSMAVHRGLRVDLPLSTTAEIDKQLLVSITVKSDGSVYLDKVPVDLDDLKAALQAKSRQEKVSGVLLFADRNLSYQALFQVLDRIRSAGLSRISLQAEMDKTN